MLVVFGLVACEDVIEIDVLDGEQQLVVDAWLTDQDQEMQVKLSYSQPYFDNSPAPTVLGATVIVFEEDSTAHPFLDLNNDGVYTFNGPNFLREGKQYALYVRDGDDEFASISQIRRVPKIDSLTFEKFTFPFPPPDSSRQSGFIASFYAKDFEGEGDTYWIRTSKNGTFRNSPNNISLAYDGGFSPASQADGFLFILPIRQSINDGLYAHGDTVKVDLWSITPEAYFFLFQVRQESTNGGIFSVPSANIPSNLINLNEASNKKALGFFGVSKVSTYTAIADSTTAKPMR